MTAAVASATNTAIPLSALQYVVVSGSVADESDSDDTQEYCGPMVIRDDRPYLIQDGLYLGSCLAEEGKVHLKKAGVTHILQVNDDELACIACLIKLACSWASAADAATARGTGMVSSASQCHSGTQNQQNPLSCQVQTLWCVLHAHAMRSAMLPPTFLSPHIIPSSCRLPMACGRHTRPSSSTCRFMSRMSPPLISWRTSQSASTLSTRPSPATVRHRQVLPPLKAHGCDHAINHVAPTCRYCLRPLRGWRFPLRVCLHRLRHVEAQDELPAGVQGR